jgi:hypothetical protein
MCEQPEKEEMIGRGEKKKKKKLGQWRRNIYHKSFFLGAETNTSRNCDHLFIPPWTGIAARTVCNKTNNSCVVAVVVMGPPLVRLRYIHSLLSLFFRPVSHSTANRHTFLLLLLLRLLYQRFPRRSFRLYVSVLSRLAVSIDRPVKKDSPLQLYPSSLHRIDVQP